MLAGKLAAGDGPQLLTSLNSVWSRRPSPVTWAPGCEGFRECGDAHTSVNSGQVPCEDLRFPGGKTEERQCDVMRVPSSYILACQAGPHWLVL